MAAVPLAITDDAAKAREAFRGELARYLALPFYRAMLESSGHGASIKRFDAGQPADDSLLSVERLEWEYIQRVLAEHGGNVSATARALRMHRKTLQRKLSKHPASP